MSRLRASAGVLALSAMSCGKVPLFNVRAEFSRADAAWFAEEETLFIFYEVSANQGIADPSVIEVRWTTDSEAVDWTQLTDITEVHPHVGVDCGPNALCGSTSIAVADEPRDVDIRLRYHRDGELALEPDTRLNVVGPGPAHTNRSLLVYGVFDESNRQIQWRGRHLFPTVRNEEATALGLRRRIDVEAPAWGTAALTRDDNVHGYGADCPSSLTPTDHETVSTEQRARFSDDRLPVEAGSSPIVCAESTVWDATGPFTTGAVAQKNPEVRPAFPLLRSPVNDGVPLKFFLAPCDRVINRRHERMQRQRLQMEDTATTCTDDWTQDGFVEDLVATFSDAVAAARPDGEDMVLVVGLHQDEPGLVSAVEDALAEVVPRERHQSTPRLAGAFVFDSDARGIQLSEIAPATLWCPAEIDFDSTIPDASVRTCAIAPDNPNIELGPFTFGTIPILPDREGYLDFLSEYSEAQAGEVLSLKYRVPEFATSSEHVDLGEFGVVTFLNDERISAEEDDAFSYCPARDAPPVVFRSEIMQSEDFLALLAEACDAGEVPPQLCDAEQTGLLTLDLLPRWHATLLERDYELGLYWDFPFLLRMRFETVTAGNVSALGLTVPFGVASNGRQFLGTSVWQADEFELGDRLAQCTRFCDHPTFDNAGVYHPRQSFVSRYAQACYRPDHPTPGDGGFPRDP